MYPGEYQLIGNQYSMFTRKLEAQLRFQDIPWRYQFKTLDSTPAIEQRAGTHFIPVLTTPEKWMIHDTIAIGPMLNDRFSRTPVIPATPLQRSACFILEDFFNHWLGRTAVHTRWCYPNNVDWIGKQFAINLILNRSIAEETTDEELEPFSGMGEQIKDSFGMKACINTGAGPDQGDAVKGDFDKLLTALNQHLSQHRFLLGDRPCLADFALAGACKAHFIADPEPLSWLGEYRNMLVSYTDQFYDDNCDKAPIAKGDWPCNDQLPESLSCIFDYMQSSYLNYARATLTAINNGDKTVRYDFGFGDIESRVLKRNNMARLHVQGELKSAHAETDRNTQAYFFGRGILEYYFS